jgi:hypothetical protein
VTLAVERSLATQLRPALLTGLLIGLAVSGVLAIPWFGAGPEGPRLAARKAEAPPPAPEPASPEAGAPAPEAPPPLSAESPEPGSAIADLVPAEAPVYRPSAELAGGSLEGVRSAPVIRAGVASSLPEIRALGPEHVGATHTAAPILYWFLSAESPVPVMLRLAPEPGSPLLELRLPPPVGAGLRALQLGRHGVRLQPGVSYRWSVALAPDPEHPEAELVSAAAVRRAEPAPELAQALAAAAPAERAHLLAAAGYWYDAFELLTGWIQAEPEAPLLREHRSALLEQVGLSGVAGLISAPAPTPVSASEGRDP